jgi:hypothetical protein
MWAHQEQILFPLLFLPSHLFFVVLEHHEVGAGVLDGLHLVLPGLGLVLEVLQAIVESGEPVDLLLVAQGDVDLAVRLE